MSAFIGVLLSTGLVIAVFTIVYCRIRIRILRVKLQQEMHNKAELTNFLGLFSRNIHRMDDAEKWMNVTLFRHKASVFF